MESEQQKGWERVYGIAKGDCHVVRCRIHDDVEGRTKGEGKGLAYGGCIKKPSVIEVLSWSRSWLSDC